MQLEHKKRLKNVLNVVIGLDKPQLINQHKLSIKGYILYSIIGITCIVSLINPLLGLHEDLGLKCIFKHLTHYPCPTCGFSRAVQYSIRGDFKTGILYSPLWILLVVYHLYLIVISTRALVTSRQVLINKRILLVIIISLTLSWILKFVIGETYY